MFRSALGYVDMFGVPVMMNFSGKEKSKTTFGGFCSLLFFGFTIWAIYNGSQDLFSTSNPTVISYDAYVEDPRQISVSPTDFPIAFALQGPAVTFYKPFINDSIYTINVQHSLQTRITYPNGTSFTKWTLNDIALERCQSDYFSGSSFATLNLGNSLCISKNQPNLPIENLLLQGVYSSSVYQTLVVTVSACDNATSAVTCADPDTIDLYLSGSWFNALYLNSVINPQNYSHPNSRFRDIYYTMISPSDYKETEVQLGYVELTTDTGRLISQKNEKQVLTKINKVSEYLQSSSNSEGVLIQCTFMGSTIETYYLRSYKKIQAVIAEVSGLANTALVILFIVTAPYIKLKFRESLVNELFDIKMKPKTLKKKKGKKGIYELTQKLQALQNQGLEAESETEKKGTGKGKLKEKVKLTLDRYKGNPITTSGPSNPSKFRFDVIQFNDNKRNSLPSSPQNLLSSSSICLSPSRDGDRQLYRNDSIASSSGAPISNLIMSPNQSFVAKHSRFSKPKTMQEKRVDSLKEENLKNVQSPEISILSDKEKLSFRRNNDRSFQQIFNVNKDNSVQPENKFLEDDAPVHLSFSSEGQRSRNLDQEENRQENIPENIPSPEVLKLDDIHKKLTSFEGDAQEQKRDSVLYVGQIREEHNESSYISNFNDETVLKREKSEKINLTAWEYILSFFYQTESMKQKMSLVNEGVRNIDERLDVFNIQKKLREIDKLRALLLDHHQLVLFNNLPKPEIRPKGENNLSRSSTFSNSMLKDSKFISEHKNQVEVLESYRHLKYKLQKTELDRRLLEIFDDNNS